MAGALRGWGACSRPADWGGTPASVGVLAGSDRGTASCWVEPPAGASAHPCPLPRVSGRFLVFLQPTEEETVSEEVR